MAIIKDLKSAQAEIDRLTKLVSQGGIKTTQITLGEYQGAAMLNFTGNFKPFNISVNKASKVLDHMDRVKALIAEAKAAKAG